MRNKRKQKRLSKLPVVPKKQELPDPFSANNPDLVEHEVNLEGWCPCCVDRQAELEGSKKEREYLDWFNEGDSNDTGAVPKS